MNARGIIRNKLRRKTVQNTITPKIDLDFSNTPKISESKKKLSSSPRTKIKILNHNNNNFKKKAVSKHISMNNINKKSYSIYKQFQLKTKTKTFSKRNSVQLFQKQQKQNILERNNNNYINAEFVEPQLNQIEYNIKNVLHNMRKEIEEKKEKEKEKENDNISHHNDIDIIKKSNKMSSSPDLKFNFLKKKQRTKKKNEIPYITVLMKSNTLYDLDDFLIKENTIKRAHSLDLTEQAKKKVIRRMKNKIIKKNTHDKFFQTEIVTMDSTVEENLDHENSTGYTLHPNCTFILIFDIILIFANLYSFIFIPLKMAKNEDERLVSKPLDILSFYIVDLIYFLDFIITIFKGYYNHEMKIIRNNCRVLIHYLKQNFFIDLIEGIPLYSIIRFEFLYNPYIYFGYFDLANTWIKLLLLIKPLKIIKIITKKKNQAIDNLREYAGKNYHLENIISFIFYFIVSLLFVHLSICLHIFLANQDYPNWISHTNVFNKDFTTKYITSFYFLMTTLTTVGYGDIVCISGIERIFHIILLVFGTIIYTFVVSKIGNYLREQSHEQIKLDKDLIILENIRVTYPKMTFKLYYKIQNHLLNLSKTRKKTGISLLINGIPDAIKSELLLRIYSKVIKEFSIFKNVNNSRFILQVLTSFIPITLKKEEILLLEGEEVNNVIFVKDGRLSMEIAININDPYKSIQKYFENNFIGITRQEIKSNNSINKVSSLLNMKRNYKDLKAEIDNVLLVRQNNLHNNSSSDAHGISADLGRLDFTRKESDLNRLENYEIIKIFDVRKNEYFGDVHMFLERPSPFTLKAKSRIVEILLLRRYDAMHLSENFPNIWRKIHDKSYHNLVSIKKLAFKILSQYYNTHFYHKKNRDKNFGFNMENSLSKSFSFLDKPNFIKRLSTKKKFKLIKQNNHKNQMKTIKKNKSTKIKINDILFIDKMNPRKSSEKTLHYKFGMDSGNTNSSFRFSQTIIKPILSTSPKELDNFSNNTNGLNSNNNINNIYTKTKSYKRVVTFKEDNNKIGEYASNKKLINNNNNKKTLLKSKTRFSKLNIIKDDNNTSISEFNEIIKSINGSRRESSNINIENNNDNNESLSSQTIKVCKTEGNLKGVSLGKENIFTLEDIDYNFSKRMKKKMRMRKKIEKIIDSLELKRKENNKYLFNIYSNIIGKKLNPILKKISTTDDVSCLQNSLAEELVNITFTNDNSNVFSNLLDSTSSEEDSKKKFDNNSLNIITQEFFEIKSSYKNINVLSKGKIIKNLKYKKFIENFIKINLNKNILNDKKFKALMTKYTEKPKKNKTKELKYIRSGTEKYHNKILSSERINSFNSKKKVRNASQSNIKLNFSSNNNLEIYLNDKKYKNSKLDIEDNKINYQLSGFNKNSFIRNITKTEENNTNEKNLNTETNFYKEEEKNLSKTKYLEIPKNNKNIINNNINNNTNNKSYTSSINIINESEKNEFPIQENKLELLNRNHTINYKNKTKTTLNNNLDNNDSQNNKCEIF